uniref:Ymf61 n=1 Tax=Ichthyophthirius multifiliis TaxID=5932 RepID=G1FLD0_ICHMU|nr:Ymf61 [Ichthyophthirius multifiliis]AEL89272.1 Ymf61 [Ichthyophthirius multifiliis]
MKTIINNKLIFYIKKKELNHTIEYLNMLLNKKLYMKKTIIQYYYIKYILIFICKYLKLIFKDNNWSILYLFYSGIIYFKLHNYFNSNFVYYKKLKYNIIIINYLFKQLKLTLCYFNFKNFNFSVGKVLSSLNIVEKFKKKSKKGEDYFYEYIKLYLWKYKYLFLGIMYSILKFKQIFKRINFNNKLIKLFLKRFKLKVIINYAYKPNSYSYFKKIKSIKRKFRKKFIKYENNNLI